MPITPAIGQTPHRPPAVTQKMVAMDAACRVAGRRPGGGAYIFVQDFSGDVVLEMADVSGVRAI